MPLDVAIARQQTEPNPILFHSPTTVALKSDQQLQTILIVSQYFYIFVPSCFQLNARQQQKAEGARRQLEATYCLLHAL